MAHDLCLEREQHEPEHDEQQARDVERQAPEPDEREQERHRAQDPGDKVRVLELEQEPVEADGEQHERHVRVAQQVEQRLERVHPDVDHRRVGQLERLRDAVDRDLLAVGLREHLVERRGDPVHGTGRHRRARG